jgi:hypothetical protein
MQGSDSWSLAVENARLESTGELSYGENSKPFVLTRIRLTTL